MGTFSNKRLINNSRALAHRSDISCETVTGMKGVVATKRISTALILLLSLGIVPVISGCAMPQPDPSKQIIPTDSDQWQKKLGDTFEQLSESDRQLLSRYMLRMKLSDAYESGANTRVSIKQALVQQREYERLHPNNPTGKKSPIVTSKQLGAANNQTYSIALLPVRTSDSDSLNDVKLQFILSNHGTLPIRSFKGSLLMQDAKLAKGKRFNVPLTQFVPPIAPNQSSTIILETSIEDINVMRAIRNAQDVTIKINEGTLVFIDGQRIEFDEMLAK